MRIYAATDADSSAFNRCSSWLLCRFFLVCSAQLLLAVRDCLFDILLVYRGCFLCSFLPVGRVTGRARDSKSQKGKRAILAEASLHN